MSVRIVKMMRWDLKISWRSSCCGNRSFSRASGHRSGMEVSDATALDSAMYHSAAVSGFPCDAMYSAASRASWRAFG